MCIYRVRKKKKAPRTSLNDKEIFVQCRRRAEARDVAKKRRDSKRETGEGGGIHELER